MSSLRTGQLPPLGPGSFSGFCHLDHLVLGDASNTTRKAGHQGISPGTGVPPEQAGN